ncbi:MAG: GDSL-type esterase/lipase family protein [Pseudoflavonifractor sp.]|nr:GDSL-type esterase/lipase family protein [Alloprevotella sp.]MCM1116393.1 GDSL-type esterase/lipase family protein [Pseudoflavonifractor sp.]
MIKRLPLLMALLALTVASAAWADVPFRLHRYDSFRAAEVNNQSIVFFGNSITNMHEWREAFGDNPNIINRGNSGGYSYELLDNIESVIQGKPAKVFIGIGTNDLGTSGQDDPTVVAGYIQKLVERFKAESPKTQVFVQSILPSWNGLRTEAKTRATNTLLKDMCEKKGATYIDLFDTLAGIPNGDPISFDCLHVTAHGYTLWCRAIEKYVGEKCTYPDPATATYSSGGMHNSNGMRVTQWSASTVKPTDILIIGDEMIHGGEWHELLHNPDVKSRGIGWGYGGQPLTKWGELIPAILTDNPSLKSAPKKVFLYMGIPDVNDTKTNFSVIINNYTAVIDKIKKLAPTTEINILSYIPRSSNADNENRIVPANDRLKALCAEMEGVNFVDIYTPLTSGVNQADATCITNNYLYGKGYNKVAQVLAPLTGGKAMTDAEFEAHYALINARTAAGKLVQALLDRDPANEVAANALKTLAGTPTLAEVNALATPLTEALTGASMPEGGEGKYYTIKDRRSSRFCTDSDGKVMGETSASTPLAQWNLLKRQDGTWDIVNHGSGLYISSSAAYNTQLTLDADAPASGWQLLPSDEPGYLIIVNGTAQFNTTNGSLGYKVYNWGSGNNTSDTGCQYIFTEVEAIEPPTPGEDTSNPDLTLTSIDLSAGPVRLPDSQGKQFTTFSGAQTVAVDFTKQGNGKRQIIVAAAKGSGSDGEFFSVFADNSKGGVLYSMADGTDGFFTKAPGVGDGRTKLVVTMSNNLYTFYVNGQHAGDINVGTNAAWTFKTFGNFADAEAIYLGGIPATSRADSNKASLSGEIHSLRLYNRELTAAEIAALTWDDLTPTGIEEVAVSPASAHKGIFDLQGRRLQDATVPGLYIIDGRKTLIR